MNLISELDNFPLASNGMSLRDMYIVQKWIQNQSDCVSNGSSLTVHHFSDGMYARELLVPAGMIVCGATHTTRFLNIMSKGKCILWTDKEKIVLDANNQPLTLETKPDPYTKRIVFALEDTIWTTFHRTDLTKIEDIESDILADEEEIIKSLGGLPDDIESYVFEQLIDDAPQIENEVIL